MQNQILESSKEKIEGYQLSSQQKYIWSLQNQNPETSYRIVTGVLIEGNLNYDLLDRALNQIVNCYEILRTNFQYLPGMQFPIQVICDRNFIWHKKHNFSHQNQSEQEKKIEELFQDFIKLPFDFEKGFLLHVSLVILAPNKHILFLGLPALCCDAIAMNNLVAEIGRTYTSYLQEKELHEEPLQYADLAQWQNELLDAEDGEIGINYWRKQNLDSFTNFQLPYEQTGLDASRFQYQALSWEIKPEITEKIQIIADNKQSSIATFLLACWQTLLYRLTGQLEILISTAFAGRKHQELESVVGLLVKYLPIAIALQDNLRFNELLQLLEEKQSDAYKWQEYYTGDRLHPSESELLFLSFAFEFQQLKKKFIDGALAWSFYKHYDCLEPFKIKLKCVQIDDRISLEFYYDANLFLAEDMQRLVKQFQVLLASIIADLQAKISELDIVSDREKNRLLIEFNQTQTEYPNDKCFHQLFEERVALTPNNIAVVFQGTQLTYQELNERANQLAHYLQSLGVGAEVIVGICVERSLEMLVGLLGILKAGGAYLPLDPAYPQERLAFMLEDARLPILLTQQSLAARLPKHHAQVICLDRDREIIERYSIQNLKLVLSEANVSTIPNPSNLAYVIYTSGSTGKPKGTLITHQGLVNYLSWCVQAYAVAEGNGSCVHSSLAFDATITGLFAPLLVGNKVHLVSEELGLDALANIVANNSNYSLIKITPAQLELLSQQLSPQQAADCTKAFIIGGEKLTTQTIAFWQKYAPKTRLINEYGPTETVVGCCVYNVPIDTHQSGSIPIGRPIANTQLYILDRNLNPVPIGIPGELYIGGEGVARGYLNRPDLTAEKFIPHPFSNIPGARLYKTGDLAKYLPNGEIEYLGRIDNQVKIRGYRVELGEIEAIIGQEPTIKKAVVILREDEPDNKRLVAYLVPHSKQQIDISDLRNFLQDRLPDYMIPSAFVFLKTLPLTTNGKIDRQALPKPENLRSHLAVTFVAPRNAIENAIADIWTEVLKLEKVGIHDNFFDLGGHSLLLTQVTSRLYNAFGVELSLRQLFTTPTIAQLSELIAAEQIKQADSEILEQILTELEQQ
jgi:amino acid adenylation domain-containing protein